jgi:hypothetical protein
MTAAITTLRLSFILLFGAMSVLHGPVMTFSGPHASTPDGYHQVAVSDHATHHGTPGCHDDHDPSAKRVQCNAFACFMAVEPLPVMVRPLRPVLFTIMAAAPAPANGPLQTAQAIPPPRLQS